ncbi:MAG: NCS2 family permease [Candidatus Thermoplasmatota archaeon]
MISKMFDLDKLETDEKTEIRAGITTFLTMAYIIIVNPAILSAAGVPLSGVLFATVIVSASACILMGVYANLPFALAPGMGLNAFVTYTLILGQGVIWETAMGAIIFSGIIFMLLSLPGINVREKMLRAIPEPLRLGVASGIGLFLAFIGLQDGGVIVADEATLVAFGGMSWTVGLFIVGLILTGILLYKKQKGALIIGILSVTALGLILTTLGTVKVATLPEKVVQMPDISLVGDINFVNVFTIAMIGPLFTLLFTDLFDSISTFLGVAEAGDFKKEDGAPRNTGKALFVDGFATTISGIFGTSPATTYVESASGVEEGGRSGMTAVVVGLLFLPFMFISPIIGMIPAVATGPILVLVGLFMTKTAQKIKWDDYEDSIPAFIAMIAIPLTFNITNGIILGIITYVIIKSISGEFREIPITLWFIFAFSIAVLFLL